MNPATSFAFFLIASLSSASGAETAVDTSGVYRVHPEAAKLEIERIDYASQSIPVLVRTFRRLEKERGLFGPAWCSNLDLALLGLEGAQPRQFELHDCQRGQSRIFRKVLDAWVEEGSGSRILRKPDGRWELTEVPFAIFRADGKLESFQTENRVRWYLRRDAAGNLEALDNLKQRPVKFHRNQVGDLDAILDASGKALVKYRLSTMLESTTSNGSTESFEYDADGNILKLTRSRTGDRAQLWRFSYTTAEWVSTIQHPDGCVSRWIFERSAGGADDNSIAAIAKESKSCRVESAGSSVPAPVTPIVRKVASAPKGIGANGSEGLGAKSTGISLRKPGPLGVGDERAEVTLNHEGMPVLFEITDASGKRRRLVIEREDISGSVSAIRANGVEINMQKKPRQYSSRQLDLLDEYEAWMSALGSR